ncbi:MAG: ATP synthase F0 subunit B [Desulfamplus sp.]|nr:ATP synthase F0 subunit B [Desulfamplus sp.]
MKIEETMKSLFRTTLPVASAIFFVFAGIALAASEGGGEAKGWVATDTYKVLNFLVLAGVLFYIARKPVAQFFSSRISDIQEQLADLEQKKADAQKMLSEYENKIAELSKESEKIVQDYVRQGEDAKKRILAEAEAQAIKLEESAKRNIEQEFKAAKAKLQQEIAEKALAQAELLVKESISSEDQDRLVDEYLDKVVAS